MNTLSIDCLRYISGGSEAPKSPVQVYVVGDDHGAAGKIKYTLPITDSWDVSVTTIANTYTGITDGFFKISYSW